MDELAQQQEAYRAQYLAAHQQWKQAAITTLAMQAQWQHECLVAAHRKREQEEMKALALEAQRMYECQMVIDHCIADWVLEELPYDIQSDVLDEVAMAFEEKDMQQELRPPLAAPCPSLSNDFCPSTPDELRHSDDPLVRQFVGAQADGPVRFHQPAVPVALDFGVSA